MGDKEKVVARLVGKPICPKCKAEIEQLSYNSNVSVTQDFSIDSDGVADYSSMEDYGDHTDAEEKTKYEENSVRCSPNLLKMMMKLCSNTKSDAVIMKFRKDYPLWLETDEIICIIAPRIDDI